VKVAEGQQKQLAGVKAKAESIMKNVSTYKYAIKGEDNIEPLQKTKNIIDNNKRLQTYEPTAEDLLLLTNAITECDIWIGQYQNANADEKKALETELKTIQKWKAYYQMLSSNYAKKDKISPVTQETISSAIDILANKKLNDAEKAVAVAYLEDLQSLAASQISGTVPKNDIQTGLTSKEMKKALGEKAAKNIVGALIFVEDTPTILVAKKTPNVEATKLHEMQHLIQYRKGELVFCDGKSFNWVYDIYDEVEAYKVQYLVAPDSMPSPIKSIDEITPDYLSEWYPNLPHTELSLRSKLGEIQNAFDASKLKNGPKDLLAADIWKNDSELSLAKFFEKHILFVQEKNIKYKK
jgi:hypothetical protein